MWIMFYTDTEESKMLLDSWISSSEVCSTVLTQGFGVYKPCTFQRKDWPLTSLRETVSELLECPAQKEYRCIPEALDHTR